MPRSCQYIVSIFKAHAKCTQSCFALYPQQCIDAVADACRSTAGKAVGAVDVPESVIDVLTSLRNYLQDKCEPPIYVSDRRFMKALNLLQVAAYADGREQVCCCCSCQLSCTVSFNTMRSQHAVLLSVSGTQILPVVVAAIVCRISACSGIAASRERASIPVHLWSCYGVLHCEACVPSQLEPAVPVLCCS